MSLLPRLLLLLLPAWAVQAETGLFEVSYAWGKDAAAIKIYQAKVAQVLGKDVAPDLKVVLDSELYGLVYHRPGKHAFITQIARHHSRILVTKGLEPAAVIPSQNWKIHRFAASQVLAIRKPAKPRGKLAKQKKIPTRSINLEAAVETHIKKLRKTGRIGRDERTGWSVYDFTSGKKLVTINEELPMQAASLIKPFVAAAFFHKVKKGKLHYGPKSRRHMRRMIQHSNNPSTNWVMRQVGGPKAVQRILKRHYGGIFRHTRIVEYIPGGGRTYRNKASARDYSRFLYAVWNDRIPYAKEIKRLMALPGSDRIYTGAESVPVGTRVINKTGSTARLCADMGILNVKGKDGKRYPYTLIGIIEKKTKAGNYTSWIRSRSEVIRDVSDIIYEGIAEWHDFGGA